MTSLGVEIELAQTNEDNVLKTVTEQIQNNDLLLFIKGTPVFPQCGYSARVVQIMDLLGHPYKAVDVLKDDNIREAIKSYSDWPTIPQVYFKQKFIGGCDILTEMYQNGELQKLFSNK